MFMLPAGASDFTNWFSLMRLYARCRATGWRRFGKVLGRLWSGAAFCSALDSGCLGAARLLQNRFRTVWKAAKSLRFNRVVTIACSTLAHPDVGVQPGLLRLRVPGADSGTLGSVALGRWVFDSLPIGTDAGEQHRGWDKCGAHGGSLNAHMSRRSRAPRCMSATQAVALRPHWAHGLQA